MPKISIDAMGGDWGPSVIVPAAILALKKNHDLSLILVGKEEVLKPLIKPYPLFRDRLEIFHASEVVEMNEAPLIAVRQKKDSSMRAAINLVKEGKASACVSAGNTGALMMTAKFVLNTLPHIDRPAIISALPTLSLHPAHVLDLGANVDSSPEQLVQFAIMGSVLVETVKNINSPRVALLNIGQEEIKGNAVIKAAHDSLNQIKAINYIGYIEGNDIYHGKADVVVCDGFVGNIALKVSEGLAKFIAERIRSAFGQNFLTKCCAFMAWPVLRRIKHQLDPRKYNGATLIGLQGIVVKSHGNANKEAFFHAIEEASLEVKRDMLGCIGNKVEHLFKKIENI